MVGGNLQLAGTVRFDFEDGFSPHAGDTFDVIKVNGTSQLSKLHIEVGNAGPGFQYDFSPIPGGYRFTALTTGQFTPQPPGDFNLDGQLTTADLPAMLNALTDLSAHRTLHALSDADLLTIGDLNSSGALTNADIQPLLDLLAAQSGGGSLAAVPEPSGILLSRRGTRSRAAPPPRGGAARGGPGRPTSRRRRASRRSRRARADRGCCGRRPGRAGAGRR